MSKINNMPLNKAEEAVLIAFELSKSRAALVGDKFFPQFIFRWSDLMDAASSVFNQHRRADTFKMTFGNILRSLVYESKCYKIRKGLYVFDPSRIHLKTRMYKTASSLSPHKDWVENRHLNFNSSPTGKNRLFWDPFSLDMATEDLSDLSPPNRSLLVYK